MELIRINDRKLKIMLTPSDMSHFEMNAERLGEDTEQMRRSFRMLMKEVRRKIAFDLDDRRVSVQYFPSREGGCEMFVSCTLQEEKKKAPAAFPLALLPIKSEQKTNKYRREIVVRIQEMRDLLKACKRLKNAGFEGESCAFSEECGGYLLFLSCMSDSPFAFPEKFAFLAEYGSARNLAQARLYILEHANIISENAVEKLAGLA